MNFFTSTCHPVANEILRTLLRKVPRRSMNDTSGSRSKEEIERAVGERCDSFRGGIGWTGKRAGWRCGIKTWIEVLWTTWTTMLRCLKAQWLLTCLIPSMFWALCQCNSQLFALTLFIDFYACTNKIKNKKCCNLSFTVRLPKYCTLEREQAQARIVVECGKEWKEIERLVVTVVIDGIQIL